MKFTRLQLIRIFDRLEQHPEEIIGLRDFLVQVIRSEFDTYNQKLPTRNEIRQEWFANNFVKRPKLEVLKPEFPADFGENATNYLKIDKKDGNRILKAEQHKHWTQFFHADEQLDKKHANIKQPTERPEIKAKELIGRQAEIKKENEQRQFYTPLDSVGRMKRRKRAERKLSVAKVMAEFNPTNRAIERYQYLLMVESAGFPGLPSHYTRKLRGE